MKRFLQNLSLTIFSLLILWVLLEFGVFRFILVPGDVPELAYVDEVLKFKPNQRGEWRVGDEIRSEFQINANGWNSGHANYTLEKSKRRIAIIGDSYVESFQNPYNQSVAEQLEKLSGDEVYRFGISGAPLSQYLHLFRKEVLPYHPDYLVFVIVHNDLHESYLKPNVPFGASFMTFQIGEDGEVQERLPMAYQQPWYIWLRRSAMARYLIDRQRTNLGMMLERFLIRSSDTVYQANIDIGTLQTRLPYDRSMLNYVFSQIKTIAAENGIQPIIVMDGVRPAIYDHYPSQIVYENGVLVLNKLCAEIAQQYEIPFIDLHPIFEADFKIHNRRFNFESDAHWNIYGHGIVAKVLQEAILRRPFFKPTVEN